MILGEKGLAKLSLLFVLAGLIFGLACFVLIVLSWWDTGYIYRLNETVYSINSITLNNFPYLVNGSYFNTKALVDTSKLRSDCADLKPVNSSGIITPFEFESYSDSNYGCNAEKTIIWNRQTVAGDNTTVVEWYYGNSTNSTLNNNTIGVWDSSYRYVLHFGEGVGFQTKNSTSDKYLQIHGLGTSGGSNPSNWTTSGFFGNGLNSNGTILLVNLSRNVLNATGGTVEVWVKRNNLYNSASPGTERMISDIGGYFHLSFDQDPACDGGVACNPYDSATRRTCSANKTWAADIWHYVVCTWNSTRTELWIDGNLENGVTMGNGIDDVTQPLYAFGNVGNNYINATLDEIRISTVQRSNQYIKRNWQYGLLTMGTVEGESTSTSTSTTSTTSTTTTSTTTSVPPTVDYCLVNATDVLAGSIIEIHAMITKGDYNLHKFWSDWSIYTVGIQDAIEGHNFMNWDTSGYEGNNTVICYANDTQGGYDYAESEYVNVYTTTTSTTTSTSTTVPYTGWLNYTFGSRIVLNVSNNMSYDRLFDPIEYNVSVTGTNNCNRIIRVSQCNQEKSCSNETEIARDILGGDNSTWCKMIFETNVSSNSWRHYFVYYNNTTSVEYPTYPTDMIYNVSALGNTTRLHTDFFSIGVNENCVFLTTLKDASDNEYFEFRGCPSAGYNWNYPATAFVEWNTCGGGSSFTNKMNATLEFNGSVKMCLHYSGALLGSTRTDYMNNVSLCVYAKNSYANLKGNASTFNFASPDFILAPYLRLNPIAQDNIRYYAGSSPWTFSNPVNQSLAPSGWNKSLNPNSGERWFAVDPNFSFSPTLKSFALWVADDGINTTVYDDFWHNPPADTQYGTGLTGSPPQTANDLHYYFILRDTFNETRQTAYNLHFPLNITYLGIEYNSSYTTTTTTSTTTSTSTSTSTSTTSTSTTSTSGSTTSTTTIPVTASCNYTVNVFSDGSSFRNVTLGDMDNKTIYVNMSKYAYVTIARFNVSGFGTTNYSLSQDEETAISYSFNNGGNNCTLEAVTSSYDENWNGGSRVYVDGDVGDGTAYCHNSIVENYTINKGGSLPMNISLRYFFYIYNDSGDVTKGTMFLNVSAFNFSASVWVKLFSHKYSSVGTMSPLYTWYNISITNDFMLNRLVMTKTDYGADGGSKNSYVDYHEQKIMYDSYPINVSLDVGGDSDYNFTYTGELNETNSPQETADVSGEINNHLFSCSPTNDNCNIPLVVHSDIAGVVNLTALNITYCNGFNYQEEYVTSGYESESKEFKMRFIMDKDVVSDVNSNFYFNATNESYTYRTGNASDQYIDFTKVKTLPLVTGDTSYPFYWLWNISYQDGSKYNNTMSAHSILVYDTSVGVCNATLNTTALNFEILEEDNNTYVPSNMEYFGSIPAYNISFAGVINNIPNFSICISPSNGEFYLDLDLIYSNASYTTRNYYLRNASISNATQNITLYQKDNTHNVRFKVKTFNYVPVQDAIISIQKLYWGNNTFKTVAMVKTDYDGEGYTYLKTENEYYKFIVSSGNKVYVFATKQLYYDASVGYVTVTLNLGEAEELASLKRFYATCSYNQTTLLLRCYYTDTSGLHSTICLDIYKRNGTQFNNNTYHSCTNDVSATLYTVVSNDTGEYFYKFSYTDSVTGIIYTVISGYFSIYSSLDLAASHLLAFLSCITVSSFGLVTINKPEYHIIGVIMGLIVTGILAIQNVTIGGITLIGIIGLILIHKIKAGTYLA